MFITFIMVSITPDAPAFALLSPTLACFFASHADKVHKSVLLLDVIFTSASHPALHTPVSLECVPITFITVSTPPAFPALTLFSAADAYHIVTVFFVR